MAFSIHVLTASGAALAFLALVFVNGGHYAAMFGCLGLALIVDGIDGPLARRVGVARVLPRWSGDTLDLVVDFLTYVFVPAYAIAASGLLPQVLAVITGLVIIVTGAIYFADREMKIADNYFRGFPAVWNLIAFYLYVFEPPSWICAGLVIGFVILTFVPVKFVHPTRVEQLRTVNITLMAVWAVLAVLSLGYNLYPPPWIRVLLLLIALYFTGVGLFARTREPA
ncbi:MAG: Phosphatidylcholine synthase [Pseudolabrys sp.]|nr:Phosphatidylcholine synthase [Pseudolabrys sp.]